MSWEVIFVDDDSSDGTADHARGLARRDADDNKITTNDRRFLESLHIQVDQEILHEEREAPKFEMTPQDMRFLKSLKITLDESE